MALGKKEAAFWSKFRDGLLREAKGRGARILIDRIESGRTSRGIPDAHITDPEFGDCWLELKVARGAKVNITPLQADWLARRARAGSRCRIVALIDRHGTEEIRIWNGLDAHLVGDAGILVPAILDSAAPYDWQRIRFALYHGAA